MRVLFLGPPRPRIEDCVTACGDTLVRTESRLSPTEPPVTESDFIVSYGYRHIISADVLRLFGHCAINVHISKLPWNRGADPNIWSFLEDTPKGVSIHVLDEGLDTGPLLAQVDVPIDEGDTLRVSYDRLSAAAVDLFCENWPRIRTGELPAIPQVGQGTSHRSADRIRYEHLLTKGWDTPVSGLVGKALEDGGRART
ncbi:MAG: formyl transferase [Coriobacteriales bacterium]|nr:formyl transferase [Coriobacteriales bacterium]